VELTRNRKSNSAATAAINIVGILMKAVLPICTVTAAISPSRLRKNELRDKILSSLSDFMIRERFWLHPLVSRGFIFGPAGTTATSAYVA
jgi:hypothetical protein